ncbi:MAG: hypothetical protein ABSD46_14240 [Bacteroidota bacterium]
MITNTISFTVMFAIVTAYLGTNSLRKDILNRIYEELTATFNRLRTTELSDVQTHNIVDLFNQERKVMKNSQIFLVLLVFQLVISFGIGFSEKVFVDPTTLGNANLILSALTYINIVKFIFAVAVFARNPRLLIFNQRSLW